MYKGVLLQLVVGIIPARGGSKGIPRKNLREVCGKPLVGYAICEGLASRHINKLVVSTEDKEIAQVSRDFGASVIDRPIELAMDETPAILVMQHAIRILELNEGVKVDVVVLLQPTSPLRTSEDIDGAIEKVKGCDSVVSVCELGHPLEWCFVLNGDKVEPRGRGVIRRQDATKAYIPNGAIYVTHRDIIMKENRILGDDTRAFIMPRERSVDIDSEFDLKLAEVLMS